MSLDTLFRGIQEGDKRSASKLMTLIENEGQEGERALKQLYTLDGHALVIGITGWAGVGKSSLISRLAGAFLDQGKKVGVIAVDPTSPFSGGGLLGDRLRFRNIDGYERLFIRSVASRGHHGGLSRSSRAFVKIMEVMGLDVVILETVGIGQEQVGVSLIADTTVVVLAPGLGDFLQAIKSGILEIGDIFVVNKADRPDVDKTVQDVDAAIRMREKTGWRPVVMKTVAIDGSGIVELLTEIEKHGNYRETEKEDPGPKIKAASEVIKEAIKARLLDAYLREDRARSRSIRMSAREVLMRRVDPYLIADKMFSSE